MAKKNLWLEILAMVLVFGMMVVSCDNDPEGDTWSNVTSLSQLNGTWKGSYSYSETEDGITVRTTMEITQTFNASAKTVSGSYKMTMAFSGAGIAEMWPFIKETMGGEGFTVNDSNHSLSMTGTINESLDDNDIAGMLNNPNLQINQNGTKIKSSDEGMEIIMTKQ